MLVAMLLLGAWERFRSAVPACYVSQGQPEPWLSPFSAFAQAAAFFLERPLYLQQTQLSGLQ